jgi:hypothetical protein
MGMAIVEIYWEYHMGELDGLPFILCAHKEEGNGLNKLIN